MRLPCSSGGTVSATAFQLPTSLHRPWKGNTATLLVLLHHRVVDALGAACLAVAAAGRAQEVRRPARGAAIACAALGQDVGRVLFHGGQQTSAPCTGRCRHSRARCPAAAVLAHAAASGFSMKRLTLQAAVGARLAAARCSHSRCSGNVGTTPKVTMAPCWRSGDGPATIATKARDVGNVVVGGAEQQQLLRAARLQRRQRHGGGGVARAGLQDDGAADLGFVIASRPGNGDPRRRRR